LVLEDSDSEGVYSNEMHERDILDITVRVKKKSIDMFIYAQQSFTRLDEQPIYSPLTDLRPRFFVCFELSPCSALQEEKRLHTKRATSKYIIADINALPPLNGSQVLREMLAAADAHLC